MITKFNKTILIVASVLLILGLIIIGIIIVRSLEGQDFPPIVTDCPDYWNVTYNNTGINRGEVICRHNQINSGYSTSRCRNYSTSLFKTKGTAEGDIMCEKSKWAKDCNIHWDGITNNPKACENTTM
jgi:hypothetical protein